MKKLFVSVLAIAGLVACNNEQTLVQQGPAPMEFGGAFVENALTTRAAEDPSYKTATLEAFDVWAWMDDENGMVLTDENVELVGGKWGYASTQYWTPDHTYFFDAVAPMDSANWTYDLAAEKNTIAFKNVDGTEDLLYATAKVETFGKELNSEYDAVKLSFKHLLSKTKFTFKNGFPVENVSIVVKNVEMTSYESATYNTVDKTWGDVSGDIVLAYGDVEETFSGKKTEATYERLTIPADASKVYTVTYDLYVYQGENLAYTILGKEATVTDVAFEQGKAYNFVATFTPDNVVEGGLKPIEFEVEVEDWVYAGQDEGQIEDAELRAALQLGGEVTLQKDYTITESLIVPAGVTSVINLNGNNIINATDSEELGEGDGIVVYGHLTINGEGTVQGKTRSVWARGNDNPTVTINGGNYVGAVGGSQCEVIYASGNGVITINGGTFEAQTQDTESFAAPQYAVLNIHGNGATGCDIVVYGGSFKNFDPANNISENPAKNFCAEGYGVAVDGEWYTVVKTTVSTAADFKALFGVADEVKLAADIDLSGSEWTPVGTSTDLCKTSLDGQGHKIIGLNVSGDYAGLIAYAAEGVTVKNVIFEDVKVESEKFGAAVICVANENVTVENVTVSGTVNCGSYAAGIVCFNSYDEDPSITIKDCVNNATVNGNRAAGIGAWITGNSVIENVVNNGDVTGATSAAGIANRIAGTVTNAKNYGNIVGNGTEASAGIAGTQTGASTFEYCFNYGNVTTTKDNANSSAAGILGQTPSKAATLNYCANFGAIAAEKSYAAGIAYSLYGNVKASYCYNEGAVNGEDGAGAIAPKAQYGANDTANYCLNAGAISSSKGKVYQGSNKNNSCYYYAGGSLLNVSDNAVVAEADALAVLNGGADASFFSIDNNVIVVK